jgi:hypothetical protein
VDDDVRQLFQQELPGLPEPPLGTLVQDSLRQGKRMRATRRIYGATVLATGLAFAAVVAVQADSPTTADLTAAASGSAATPGADLPAGTPSGRTGATPEGLLEILLQDLPDGPTSHYARASDGGLHVQAFLYDQSGPGMVRIRVLDGPDVLPAQMVTGRTSWKLENGNTATVSTLPEDCTRSLHVDVQRPNGITVAVDVGTCLAWDGFLLGQGRITLTPQQAVEIADDSRLSVRMTKKLIESGAKRARAVATFDEVSK